MCPMFISAFDNESTGFRLCVCNQLSLSNVLLRNLLVCPTWETPYRLAYLEIGHMLALSDKEPHIAGCHPETLA